jgi:L-arabinonolactonase
MKALPAVKLTLCLRTIAMTAHRPDLLIDCQNTLGEGVRWHAGEQRIWWTDIDEKMLYSATANGGDQRCWQLDKRLASFAFASTADTLLCAFDDEIALWHWPSDTRQTLHELSDRGLRFNDGRADRHGNFWVGTMAERPGSTGALHRVTPQGRIETCFAPISITNSLCWSPDGQTLYFSDSARQLIWRCDALAQRPLKPQIHLRFEQGEPDGAVTDSAGNLWVALWGTGSVACYAPDGGLLHRVNLDAAQPSCVAFGGPALDQLFVTSARVGLADPSAADGCLYRFSTDIPGLQERSYQEA